MKLTELFEESKKIAEALLENDGEVTPEVEKRIVFVDTHLPEKIDGYFHVLKALEVEEERFKQMSQVYAQKAKVASYSHDQLKKYLKFKMEEAGVSKLEGNDFKFSIQKAKESVEINNEELIPDLYKTTKTTIAIDKDSLYKALKAGETVPGATLRSTTYLRGS